MLDTDRQIDSVKGPYREAEHELIKHSLGRDIERRRRKFKVFSFHMDKVQLLVNVQLFCFPNMTSDQRVSKFKLLELF